MIRVLITKYSGGSAVYGINYFLDPGNLAVEDYLIINDLPLDSFPLFSDELTRDNNSVVMQGGEYDMVLSLLDNGVRSENGNTVNEFFQFGIGPNQRKRLRIMIEVDGKIKLIGFIDNTSFDFNYNWKDNDSQTLKFTVYSAEVEFFNAMQQKSYKEFSDVYSNSFEGQNFWMWTQNLCSYFNSAFNLHPDPNFVNIGVFNKCSPIHKMFYNMNCGDVLISACKGFGLLFKIWTETARVDQWNYLSVRFFNRQYGTGFAGPITIPDTIDHHELRTDVDERLLYFAVPHYKISAGQYTEGDNWHGIVAGKTGPNHIEYVDMRFYPAITPFSTQRLWIFLLPTGFPFGIWDLTGEKNLTFVNIDMVGKDLNVFKTNFQDSTVIWEEGADITDLSICRAFVKNYSIRRRQNGPFFIVIYDDDGAGDVAKDFVNVDTYMYLINQFQRVKELNIESQFDFLILAFNQAIFEGVTYTVERVSNINLDEKTYDIQLIGNIT